MWKLDHEGKTAYLGWNYSSRYSSLSRWNWIKPVPITRLRIFQTDKGIQPFPQIYSIDKAPLPVDFSRQEYWEWVAISFSRGSSQPRDQIWVFCIAGDFFTSWATREAPLKIAAAAKSLQSCLTLCDPIDGSPPGSADPGILPARTLEWVAISFSSAWKWKVKSESEVAQSCLTLSDPMDRSPPGSSAHGICRARVLEWAAIAFSVKIKTI